MSKEKTALWGKSLFPVALPSLMVRSTYGCNSSQNWSLRLLDCNSDHDGVFIVHYIRLIWDSCCVGKHMNAFAWIFGAINQRPCCYLVVSKPCPLWISTVYSSWHLLAHVTFGKTILLYTETEYQSFLLSIYVALTLSFLSFITFTTCVSLLSLGYSAVFRSLRMVELKQDQKKMKFLKALLLSHRAGTPQN